VAAMGITGQSVSTAAEEVRQLIITFDGYRWKDVFRGADSVLLFASEKGKKDSAKFINNMGEQYD